MALTLRHPCRHMGKNRPNCDQAQLNNKNRNARDRTQNRESRGQNQHAESCKNPDSHRSPPSVKNEIKSQLINSLLDSLAINKATIYVAIRFPDKDLLSQRREPR